MKENDQYKKCLGIYYHWHIETQNGLKPIIGMIEGKALKKIISYLKDTSFVKDGKMTVEQSFSAILQNWKKLEAWLQKMIKLNQIAKYIDTIIIQLTKDGRENRNHKSAADLLRAAR